MSARVRILGAGPVGKGLAEEAQGPGGDRVTCDISALQRKSNLA